MKSTVLNFFSLAVLSILLLSSPVFAQPFMDDPVLREQFRERMMARRDQIFDEMTKKLNLTPDQQQRIQEQKNSMEEESKVLMKQFFGKIEDLKIEMDKYQSDESKVAGLVTEIKVIGGLLLEKKIEGLTAMKKILTPQQYAILKNEMQLRMQSFKEKRKKFIEKMSKGEEGDMGIFSGFFPKGM